MGNARNSSRNTSRAGKLATEANTQHHGVPHTPQPWHAKQAAAQAAKFSKQMGQLNRENDAKNE
jgi:hypothetical protein